MDVASLHHSRDGCFDKIYSLIEDTVTPILQIHPVAITNLLNTVGSSHASSSLQFGGVALPPSRGVYSNDLPQDFQSLDTGSTGFASLVSLKEYSQMVSDFLKARH